MLTRQPVKGGSHSGRQRIGEMEQDCLIAHGAAHFLEERCLSKVTHSVIFFVKDAGRLALCRSVTISSNVRGVETELSTFR